MVLVPTPTAPLVSPPITRNDPPVFPPVKLPVHVTTLENARFYVNACGAWQDSRKDPEQFGTAEDVLARYPGTTEESVCRWALYGRPAEEELAFEQELERLAGYTEQLRELNAFHKQQLIERYQAMKEWFEEDRAAREPK